MGIDINEMKARAAERRQDAFADIVADRVHMATDYGISPIRDLTGEFDVIRPAILFTLDDARIVLVSVKRPDRNASIESGLQILVNGEPQRHADYYGNNLWIGAPVALDSDSPFVNSVMADATVNCEHKIGWVRLINNVGKVSCQACASNSAKKSIAKSRGNSAPSDTPSVPNSAPLSDTERETLARITELLGVRADIVSAGGDNAEDLAAIDAEIYALRNPETTNDETTGNSAPVAASNDGAGTNTPNTPQTDATPVRRGRRPRAASVNA